MGTRTAVAVPIAGIALALALLAPPPSSATPPAALGPDCPVFPADSFWHADVRSLPVHPQSGAWLSNMGGATRRLHPDFGDSGGAQPYGIPYRVVDGSHDKVSVAFDYADESDPGPYPFGPDIPIEGGSDRHALMLDRDSCALFELFAADWNGGSPTAGSGAVFDLRANGLRPAGWTSADAAGLAIFPGLLRRDEVLSGRIDHPIRMTASRTDRTYVWPARHHAGAARDPNLPPMGAWFRMKADHPTDGLHPHTKVIVEAFKSHGLILADNGSNWYFTGAADSGWEPQVISELKGLQAGSFEAVDQSSLMVDPNSGAVRGASAPASAPTTATPLPAPATTTAAPSPRATTTAHRALAPPPSTPETDPATTAVTDTPPEPSTIPALPTTTPTANEGVEPGDTDERAAPPARAGANDGDAAPIAAAVAGVVVALAAAVVALVLLRRRRAAEVDTPATAEVT